MSIDRNSTDKSGRADRPIAKVVDQPLTAEGSGSIGFAIKYYHLHNAAGFSAESIYVLSDDTMSENDFRVYPVEELGSDRSLGSKAWVCFTQTRACNAAFYRWFGETIVVPFIEKSRESAHLPLGEPRHAFIACDGEAKQLEVFLEPELVRLFDEHDVILTKTPASCSAICQPSDVSNFFKAAKKRLEYLPKRLRVSSAVKQLLSLSEEEEAEMEASIATYENMHVDTQLQQILSLTSFSIDKKAKLRDALQRIAWTIRETRTSTMVIEGYRRVGWTPIPSLAAAMSLCTASLSVAEMSTLEAEDLSRRTSALSISNVL